MMMMMMMHVSQKTKIPMSGQRNEHRLYFGRALEDHGGDLGVDGWIILGWNSRRWDVGIWTGLGWPRIETGGGRL